MSADQKRELPIDATRALMLLYATTIDAGNTDHEILSACDTILRSLRSWCADTSQSATPYAIKLA